MSLATLTRPRTVVRLYNQPYTRCVETDGEHGKVLSEATWGQRGCHFEQCRPDHPVTNGAEVTVTDLAGALAFQEAVKAEVEAAYQAKLDALHAGMKPSAPAQVRTHAYHGRGA